MIRTALFFWFLISGCRSDLCIDYGEDEVLGHIHEHSTPKGGVNAGVYTKDSTADTLESCLLKCCGMPSCGSTFFHDDTCFLIECNTTVPDACQPQSRDDDKFRNTFLINVRSLDEVQAAKKSVAASKNDEQEVEGEPRIKTECSPTTDEGCGEHELCQLELETDIIGYVCVCEDGFIREPATSTCIDVLDMDEPAVRPLNRLCEAGLLGMCEAHEECIFSNRRSRSGLCECVDGHHRDGDTGWCEKTKRTTVTSARTSHTTSKPTNEKTTTSHKHATTTPEPHADGTTVTVEPVITRVSNESDANATGVTVATGETTTVTSTTATTTTAATTTTTTPYQPVLEPLIVSVGDDKIITLPKNEVTLDAYALPQDSKNKYQYQWSLVSHPEGDQVGEMVGINTNKLKLSGLIEGLYTFKIAVTADGKYGASFVNVTVIPPDRVNETPVAVVKPAHQQVNQPNDVVLDGSESTDDDKIVKYHWEQASGPMNTQKIDESELEKAMLVLKGLSPGEYRFKLTVTDSDNEQNSSFANVTVIKETDYPPKANAGSPVIINLPQNYATLFGNASTDDKEIVSYEWIKKSNDKLTADMTGVRTPVLHLQNLEMGDYTFSLKVTDSVGQTATADVNVFVRQEHNTPPVANAGLPQTVWMPTDTAVLDGSNSTDDQKVEQYLWKQVRGPTTVVIKNADKVQASIGDLKIGEYQFSLTVKDKDQLESTIKTTVTVKENQNIAPEAKAGGSQVVTLPAPLVILDGSKSSDDKEIVSYTWTREETSLAAGEVVNRSDHQAILQLANLVAGRYVFTLEVVDAEGEKDTDSASIVVRPPENRNDLLELELNTQIGQFTVAKQNRLQQQLALLLHSTTTSGDTHVEVVHLDEDKVTGHMLLTFKVITVGKGVNVVRSGIEVKEILKKKLNSNNDVIDFIVVHLDTAVCQNNCSGHGQCDQNSKLCICEAFWMENFVFAYLMEQSNCDWSVLYVIIVAMVAVVSIAAFIWGCICLCRRWHRLRPKKRHRYTLLDELDDNRDNVEMIPKGKIQSSSLMVSESDFSSDEETLFINKKSNGHVKNGLVKPNKSKVRT